MAKGSENRLYGFLKQFDRGINSDISPLLLPPNQCAYATNATFRGDFVNSRPAFNNIPLTDNTGGAFQLATALFQAACFFQTSSTSQFIMVAVGGKLFQITINANNTGTINQVTLPDSLQSATATQHWIWQAEDWIIWNDGQNAPFFYDGSTATRSTGSSVNTIATTAAPFIVPAIGQAVNQAPGASTTTPATITGVLTNTPYTGKAGFSVLVNGASYYLQGVSQSGYAPGFVTMTAAQLSGATTDAVPVGANFQTQIRNMGMITKAVNAAGATITTFPISTGSPFLFTVNGTALTTNFVGAAAVIQYNDPVLGWQQVGTGTVYSSNGSTQAVFSLATVSAAYANSAIPPTGSYLYSYQTASGATPIVYFAGSQASPTTIGSTGTPQFTLTLTQPFSGHVGDTLSQNGNTFLVVSSSGSQATCQTVTGVGNPILIYSGTGVPPSLTYIVSDTTLLSSYTTVATYPTLGPVIDANNKQVPNVAATAAAVIAGIVVAPGAANPAAGQFVYLNGSTTDVFYVTAVSTPSSGSTATYLQLVNQNDTAGNTVQINATVTNLPQLPAGKMGVYGLGRNWMCLPDGTEFVAGDLVGSSSGTTTHHFRDAVLYVSQNYQLAGGGTFTIPGIGTQITGMQFVALIDASLGQGPLQVFTNNDVFGCNAPTDITTWANLTTPIVTESLIGAGGTGQNAIVQSNGDNIFRRSDGQVQSMLLARLDFNQWGNAPISREVNRAISGDPDALTPYSSMVVFDNRMLMTCKPTQYTRGVAFGSIVALNFDALSSIAGKQPSIWEGEWLSADNASPIGILQIITGFFSNVQRCFALTLNSANNQIGLVEITPNSDGGNPGDNGTTKVVWTFESPMLFEKKGEGEYKRLIDGEIYLDQIYSNLSITAYYKTDQYPTWTVWQTIAVNYQSNDPGFRPRIGLGQPAGNVFDTVNNRPLREGYDFQLKLQITGSCRFLGGRFAADLIPQPEFAPVKSIV